MRPLLKHVALALAQRDPDVSAVHLLFQRNHPGRFPDEQGPGSCVEQQVIVGRSAEVGQMGAAGELAAHALGDGAGGADELEALEGGSAGGCHRGGRGGVCSCVCSCACCTIVSQAVGPVPGGSAGRVLLARARLPAQLARKIDYES